MEDKVRMIYEINEMLESFDQNSIDSNDFDILYDMDMDELQRAEMEIRTRLETMLVTKN